MTPSISRISRWAGICLAFLIASSVFQFNALHTVDRGVFSSFDRFSQGLVTGNIIANAEGAGDPTWNLGFVTLNGTTKQSDEPWDDWLQLVHDNSPVSVTLIPYSSQYGIQGVIFRGLHKLFGIEKKARLQLFNSVAFSLVITALALLFSRAYDRRFGAVFFLVMITSPWVVSFARNLYWVPFTWFLPAVFATLAYLARTYLSRTLCLLGVGAAVFLKSLAGYEYLSNVTLFACSVFVIAPFFRERAQRHGFNFALGCLAFIACVIGFVCALLIHAGMRGDTVAQGLLNIFEQDVRRRTYGDPSNFDPVLRESLSVSAFDVIAMYWNKWATPVLTGVAAQYLNMASAFVAFGLLYSLAKKRAIGLKVLALLLVYFLASISWFVAAKAHSWVHTQLNYVMWYFGFVQALVYGVLSLAVLLWRDFRGWRRSLSDGARRLVSGSAVAVLLMAPAVVASLRAKHFDEEIDARIATSISKADVGSGFEVLFFKDRNAMLIKAECSDFDASAQVMFHIYPDAPQVPPQNLDFAWRQGNISTPWFSKYRGSCMANLPHFDLRVRSLEIGQYQLTSKDGLRILWQGSVDFSTKRYLSELRAMDHTDGNWEKGIHRAAPALLVHNDFVNRQSLAIGDVLKLSASDPRTISRIDYSTDYINVYFEGGLLNAQQSGFPKTLELLPR